MIRKYYFCKINTEGAGFRAGLFRSSGISELFFPFHDSYILDGGFILKLTGKQIQQWWASHLHKIFRRKVFSCQGTLSSEETLPYFPLPHFSSSQVISIKNPLLNQVQLKANPFPLPVRHTLKAEDAADFIYLRPEAVRNSTHLKKVGTL